MDARVREMIHEHLEGLFPDEILFSLNLFQDCLVMITKLAGYAHTGTNPWSEKVLPTRISILSDFYRGGCEIIWHD